ncbi:hypothetical protein OLS47_00130 [Campylobacter jejuni]|nr:hypothetical protein [Campylobacter jejuni]
MTEIQFNEIKERLAKWREERHLTYENQQAGFLGNVYEEVSEYFRAKNDLEKIDALCDIVIFCFNSFDLEFKEMEKIYDCDATKISIVDITDYLTYTTAKFMIKDFNNIYRLVFNCKHLCENLGFNFYQCMLQTIKEIESRCGYYNITLKKFVKNTGAYSKTEALDLAVNDFKLTNTPNKYFVDKEDNDYWYIRIEDNNGDYEIYCIKKWYKADYESCRL